MHRKSYLIPITPIPRRPWIARIATNWFFSYSGGGGGGGGFVRFHYFFLSNSDELRVIPDSDTMSLRILGGGGGGIGSIRLESRKNSLRLENNIRTCCTKVKESITNQLRYAECSTDWARINRNPRRFDTIREIFSHDSYKKRPVHASGHQFQNECSS